MWCLHKLDILDKHKMLIPAASLASELSLSMGATEAVLKEKGVWTSGPFRMATYNERTFPAKDGDVILAIESADPDFQFNLAVSFEVVFGTEQVLDGEPLLITMQRLGRVVDSIIETMAAKVFDHHDQSWRHNSPFRNSGATNSGENSVNSGDTEFRGHEFRGHNT